MPPTMPDSADRTRPNPVSAELEGIRAGSSNARMGANSVARIQGLRPLREIVKDVMRELDVSNKAMAKQAGCAESDMSDGLAGKKRLDIEWVWAQDDAFLLAVITRMERERGLTPERVDEVEGEQLAQLIRILWRRRARAAEVA